MKKYIYVLAAFAIAAILWYYIAGSYSPGSYANAKTYELKISEEDLIDLIEKFKEENPKFKVPKEVKLEDHKSNHWYVIYFYYADEDVIIYTWTRPSGPETSTMALVSINEGLALGNWQDINRDLDRKESAFQIQRFEELILKHLEERIQHVQ